MNWEAIGAIGEILGAAGVIVTLGYLAFQIRQNNRHLAHEAQRTRAQAVRENATAMADSAEIWIKDLNGETLTETEAFRMDRLWFRTLWSFQTSFLQLPLDQVKAGTTPFRGYYETMPSMRTAWELNRGAFDPDFVRYIEENVVNER